MIYFNKSTTVKHKKVSVRHNLAVMTPQHETQLFRTKIQYPHSVRSGQVNQKPTCSCYMRLIEYNLKWLLFFEIFTLIFISKNQPFANVWIFHDIIRRNFSEIYKRPGICKSTMTNVFQNGLENFMRLVTLKVTNAWYTCNKGHYVICRNLWVL